MDSSKHCTLFGADPWATGKHVPCCHGIEVLKDWDGTGNYHYKCQKSHPTPNPPAPSGDKFIATTTQYGDTSATACGSLDTKTLFESTQHYVVASAQSMQDKFKPPHTCGVKAGGGQEGDCWCGEASGKQAGTKTAPLGCFTCAKGRFLNATPYNASKTGYASDEINVVIADICPHGSNVEWCPMHPGKENQWGKENHLDFTHPPQGIDNNLFEFTPQECSDSVKRYLSEHAKNGCHPPW